jgi:outer membrane protein insertion porin family
MNITKILVFLLSSTLLINVLNAKSLIIENNKRLTFNDINNLTTFDLKSKNISDDDLNLIVKEIVSSDLISSVDTSFDLDNFYMTIVESLFINEIFINGNVKLKDMDILNNIPIKNNSFLDNNKFISTSKIIQNLYSSIGQKNVIINYYLEVFNDNSFNLIYEVDESSENYISNIFINGNSFISNKFIKSTLTIKEKKFFTLLSTSNFIDQNKIDNNLKKLYSVYVNNGFLDVLINYEIKNKNNKILLSLFINEGTRYRINDINFISNNEIIKPLFISNKDKIDKLLKNKFYNTDDIYSFSNNFNDELFANNNPNLSIDHSYTLIDKNSVDVNFFASESQPISINKISFFGNEITRDLTLRKQIFIKPGDFYNKQKIQKSINNLIRKPYIDNATIVSNEHSDNSVNIDISITEKVKTGNFKLGAGYSAQGGIATAVGLSDANLYGSGNKLDADATISNKSLYFDLKYNKFYLGNYSVDNTYRIFNNEEDLKTDYGYKRSSIGADFTIKIPYKYNISKDEFFTFSSGFEASDIHDLTSLATFSVVQNSGKSNNFYFNSGYVNDTSNDVFNPTRGKIHKTLISLSPSGLSDDDYIRITTENNFYFNPNNNNNSFFILSKLGLASGLSNKIKTKDSFTLGGDFKGFQYSGIGPRDSSSNYLGGTKMYQLTVGYAFPFIFDNSDTFIIRYFGTLGSLFGSEYASSFDSKKPRLSLGASMDVMTPIGPLSFSLASPIVKNLKDKTQSYDFTIGSTF